jgi:hypothetical protein
MDILKEETKKVKNKIGYECDICHKKIEYKFDFLPQRNTIKWSHPSGGWGESSETEKIDVCSLDCLLKALKDVYFGANIKLSSDFLNSLRQ